MPSPVPAIVPEHDIGPFLPVASDDLGVFNEIVGDEIDSDFSSSIGCCDTCYDDFRERWPGITFRSIEFQTQAMEIDWLVDNLRLVGLYSPAELSTLRHFVQCPRCGTYIRWHVWIYEHRFTGVAELESEVVELIALGERTPFLLLEHPLARRVLETVRSHISGTPSVMLDATLYRAREEASVLKHRQDPAALGTFGAPPPQFVVEGRFNHAGSPMLYAASDAVTASAEVAGEGDICLVAAVRAIKPLRILDLVDIDEERASFEILAAISNSALMAAPRTTPGWMRSQYVFSRFVADCALSAGYDAIRYGSTKAPEGANYVFLDGSGHFEQQFVLEGISVIVAGRAAILY